MIRLLHATVALAMLLAGLVSLGTVSLWLQGAAEADPTGALSALDRYCAVRDLQEKSGAPVTPPLVAQAAVFAQYLNPPTPSASHAPPPRKATVPPVARPAVITPKFRLLGTTYHQARPDTSLALISEPGQGERWMRRGAHLGHLVIENIERGGITYRDGSQLHEMKIAFKPMGESASLNPATPAAAPKMTSHAQLVHALPSNESTREVLDVASLSQGPE